MATINSIKVKLQKLGNVDLFPILNRACIIVEDDAKTKCPADTGMLRQSITHEVEGDVGIVGTNLEYAPYVEFGTGLFSSQGDGRKDVPWRYQTPDGAWHTTSGQKPQPYLQPALNNNRKNIIQYIQDEVKKALKP